MLSFKCIVSLVLVISGSGFFYRRRGYWVDVFARKPSNLKREREREKEYRYMYVYLKI